MPFPYLTPLSSWAVSVFEEREKNKLLRGYKNPWICLTSSAKVIKSNPDIIATDETTRANEIEKLFKGEFGGNAFYNGCVLTNNIGTNINPNIEQNKSFLRIGGSTNLSYSLGATPVGIDLDGKVITVEGETGRKVSTPIIESVDIDTDGANNTLKTAKITVRCFTLKQLEMFEMFFMKPGMNAMIEFGDNTLAVRKYAVKGDTQAGQPVTTKDKFDAVQVNGVLQDFTPFEDISLALVDKSKYNTFCENFSSYFRSDTKAIAEYLTSVRQSLGSYDRVAGKVLDYNFGVDSDGTYTATFEISQGNQLSMAVPTNAKNSTATSKSGKAASTDITDEDIIVNIMCSDLNLDKNVFTKKLDETGKIEFWKNHWFNFLKVNEQQKDTTASDKAYVSLRFILTVLMNYIVQGDNPKTGTSFFDLKLPGFKETQNASDAEADLIRIIPVESNPYLISSNEDIIYPRKLPVPTAPADPKNKDASAIFLNKEKTIDGIINGINFDTKYNELYLPSSYYNDGTHHKLEKPKGGPIGDALSIFVNYEKVVRMWTKSYTRISFLEQVLDLINGNSYGLFHLVFGVPHEKAAPVVMNHRWQTEQLVTKDQPKNYRFKPTTVNSIITEFSFNFEMSNLVAGMTIFNSRKVLAEGNAKPRGELPLPPNAYKLVDKSMYANADGYYSLNYVEYLNLQGLQAKQDQEKSGSIQGDPPPKDEATKEPVNFQDVIKEKSVNFILQNDKSKTRILIYTTPELVYKSIYDKTPEKNKTKSVVSPLSVSFTISGFSGLSPGQYFNIDGIPEIYNKIGVFQIVNTTHNISGDGWKTRIEANHKILNKV
jgi:hypothetical protein